MKISLIEVLRNVVKSINAHFFTNRAVTFTSVATGKSYVAGYCNFFFPIPYTPEPYTATLSSISAINVGTATVANYYALSPCYIYVRVQGSGFTNGGIYQATATVNMVVGGVLRNPVVARLLAIFKNGGGIDAFSQNIIGEDPHLDKRARSIINRTDILRNRNKHNTDKKWLACSSSEDSKSCANVCSSVENFPRWKRSCRSNRHPICDRTLPLFVLCEERYDIYHRSVSSNTRRQLAILAISERRWAV